MKKPDQNMTNSQRKVQRTEAIQARKAIEENFVPVEVLPPRQVADVFTADDNIANFADLAISDKLQQVLAENNYTKLTNI